jgi:hypothetical protein
MCKHDTGQGRPRRAVDTPGLPAAAPRVACLGVRWGDLVLAAAKARAHHSTAEFPSALLKEFPS